MKPNTKIDNLSLLKMLGTEERANYARYRFETDSALSTICDSGDALGPLTFQEKLGRTSWKLSGSSFYSRFRPGDFVEIRTQKLNSDQSAKFSENWRVERVMYPTPGKIEIIISSKEKLLEIDDVREVFLFKNSSSVFSNWLIRKIRSLPVENDSIILGKDKYEIMAECPNFKKLYSALNDSQKIAAHCLIGNNLSGGVQGPPGTGKTQLLQAIVSLAISSKMKVCISSFTNAAVDNLLGRVVRDNPEYDWIRIGNAEKIQQNFYGQHSTSISSTFKKELADYQLIGATLHKLAFNSSTPQVDLLIIDEAGQVPIYFWPFIQRLTKRLIVVGDQFQLPPVLSAKHANLPFDNIFSLFLNNETPMLETQYRMRSDIQAWSSEKFYKGRLVPHISVANRDYFAHSPAFITDGFVVPKKFSLESSNKYSQEEADFITNKVEKLLRSNDNLGSIGVICPYRAQAGIINASLQNRFGVDTASKILVDTVERFQGQEREAIFLSLGVSGQSEEELRFLSDPRRLNVSVTRARSRFFCLYNERLLQKSSAFDDINEFLRWVTDKRTIIKKAA